MKYKKVTIPLDEKEIRKMKIDILGIEIDLSVKKPNYCTIKGKCKYKFFSRCYFKWPNEIKAYAEDCTCLINEKLRDKI